MQITKINEQRIGLNLNPKHEIKKTKTKTQMLQQKTRNVQDQNINKFLL
jgi:hypothetical protein